MDLRELLKKNQAITDSVPYKKDGLALKLRRFSMSETATYYSVAENDPIKATLFLLKTAVLDESGNPYFTDSDDSLITGAIDSSLKPIITAFWEYQNAQGKTLKA
ncbi:hypothetical protein [Thiomicrorhabdus lithotrophica]|uniref:Uncharacterized protein n=1 Tax=Thiomicrorhabdus lithotrophica TaxID=2949997 RepID=A0ABY8C860_9GAMM|nr:hypothetical protein [Thiomicrorhabdus lithotrophica]WEJ62153.1 hypothetical protein NR989_09045 [Thiomicrorhabdus lithotrophica]